MKAYPKELRERVIKAVDEREGTIAEICEIFGVSERFIYSMLKQRREQGSLEPLAHGGGAIAKLDQASKAQLAELVKENSDATLEELRDELKKQTKVDVSVSTICRRLADIRLTLKKNQTSSRSRPKTKNSISK